MSAVVTVSRPVQRFAAIGIAAAALIGLVGSIVIPLVHHVDDLGHRIDAAQLQLATLRRLEGTAVALGDGNGARDDSARRFLAGETESLQRAALQADLGALASASGVRILSTTPIAVVQRQGLHLAGAHLVLRAPIAPVHEYLRRIEAHRPPLLIDMIELHPVPESETGTAVRLVNVQIRVMGVLRREVGQP